MSGKRLAPVTTLAVLPSLALAAGPPSPADVEILRSLPYAISSPAEDPRAGVVLHDSERTCPGPRLYTVQALSRTVLIDENGNTLHSWQLGPPSAQWGHAEPLDDGGLLVIGAEGEPEMEGSLPQIPDHARYIARLDQHSNVLWKRRMNAHHDAEIRPGGQLAVLTFERRRVPGIHPDLDVRDDGIAILDPGTGTRIDSWGFLDAVAGREAIFPLKRGAINDLGGERWVDVFHANSMEWMAEEELFGTHPLYSPGHVLVCFRQQDRVAIFDGRERRVLWAWGEEEVSGPHDAQLLPSGNILLFDNGLRRGWSRALEVDPRTDRIVWSWCADPPESFFTVSKGAAQRLPNGNVLLAESDVGRIVEVAPGGEAVWAFLTAYSAEGRRAALVRARCLPER